MQLLLAAESLIPRFGSALSYINAQVKYFWKQVIVRDVSQVGRYQINPLPVCLALHIYLRKMVQFPVLLNRILEIPDVPLLVHQTNDGLEARFAPVRIRII
ncbi:hypothetical protein D3C76_1321990 [compost metagenome]